MKNSTIVAVIEDNVFKRSAATIVDIFILNGINLFTPNLIAPSVVTWGPQLEIILLLATTSLYFIGLWTLSGQTIGKKLFRLKVIQADGNNINLRSAIYRYIMFVLMTASLFVGWFLSAFFLITTARNQGIHDKVASTIVVRMPKTVE
jgi:uncharacterized RDD family membrane protein YckC